MGHDEWVTQIVTSSTGKEIFSAGVDGRVVMWNADTGKLGWETTLPAMVLTLSLSPDGRMLAAGDAAGSIASSIQLRGNSPPPGLRIKR